MKKLLKDTNLHSVEYLHFFVTQRRRADGGGFADLAGLLGQPHHQHMTAYLFICRPLTMRYRVLCNQLELQKSAVFSLKPKGACS